MGKAHKVTGYAKAAALCRERAYADESTICWRCGLTLAQIRAMRSPKQVTWDAGHVVDGDLSAGLRPEHSYCNRRAGALMTNTAVVGGVPPTTSNALGL